MRQILSIVLLLVVFSHMVHSQITVATAANMQFAMEEIKSAFKSLTGIEVKPIYNASGKLTAQIKNGAPFDVFVSADMGYPDSLLKWGYATSKAKTYAYGVLVIWSAKGIDLTKGLSVLSQPEIRKIAIGDLTSTVYGPAAVAMLKKVHLYDILKDKFVFGENISQVAQYIVTQSADIGFNAKSVVIAEQMRGKGVWAEVDSTLYDPIAQGAVILKYGNDFNPVASRQFFDFLSSKEVREILVRFGYKIR